MFTNEFFLFLVKLNQFPVTCYIKSDHSYGPYYNQNISAFILLFVGILGLMCTSFKEKNDCLRRLKSHRFSLISGGNIGQNIAFLFPLPDLQRHPQPDQNVSILYWWSCWSWRSCIIAVTSLHVSPKQNFVLSQAVLGQHRRVLMKLLTSACRQIHTQHPG